MLTAYPMRWNRRAAKMSKYTTELRWIIEQTETNHKTDGHPGGAYLTEVYSVLGLDAYPIFDESYRYGLNDKIIDHFYLREIGFETVGLFRRMMKRTMNEIMPYYNQLYSSLDLVDEPMLGKYESYTESWTRDLDAHGTSHEDTEDNATTGSTRKKTGTDSVSGNGSDSTSTTDRNRSVTEDTPMGSLDAGALEGPAINYASGVEWGNGTSTTTTTNQDSSTTTYNTTDTDSGTDERTGTRDGKTTHVDDEEGTRTHTATGFDRPQAELLQLYRDSFLNVDMMVINELEELFMQVW